MMRRENHTVCGHTHMGDGVMARGGKDGESQEEEEECFVCQSFKNTGFSAAKSNRRPRTGVCGFIGTFFLPAGDPG